MTLKLRVDPLGTKSMSQLYIQYGLITIQARLYDYFALKIGSRDTIVGLLYPKNVQTAAKPNLFIINKSAIIISINWDWKIVVIIVIFHLLASKGLL